MDTKKLYPSILHRLSPPTIMVLGFGGIILLGAILLSLPVATNQGVHTPFLDCIFTATSAVCVTGLTVVETSLHWSDFGRTVIIILIQAGGLGFMSITASIFLIFGRKINLRQRILIKEQLNQNELSGAVRLIRNVIRFTFGIELIGALLLSTVFVPEFGWKTGIKYSLFHSISAFCNAGFDLVGEHFGAYSSLAHYYNNPVIVFTITSLIILGGIGFGVMINVRRKKEFRHYDLTSKMAIVTTIILIVVGTILILHGEKSNPESFGHMQPIDKFQAAYFQSVTSRTAGFATCDLAKFKDSTLFIMIILMFIGASPASTGGGIKTTTFAVLFFTLKAIVKNEHEVTVDKRRLNNYVIRKASAVLLIGLIIVMTCTYIITITQDNFDLLSSAFEVVSAYATVGLSIAGTPNLDSLGKVIIIFLMFAGRVGSITVFTMLMHDTKSKNVRYPETKVLVG